MRKLALLVMILGAFTVASAQKTKKGGKKKAKTHTTKRKAKGGNAVEAAPVQEDAATAQANPTPEATPAQQQDENLEPINSMSILNAKSPASFRKYREMGVIKRGDSLVSVKNTPLDYGYVNDKDVLRSIVVWEVIDLNDKINQPIYHNEDGIVAQSKSLYQLLLDAIKEHKIKEVYDDDLFTRKLTVEEIERKLFHEQPTDALIDKINAGEKVTEADRKALTDVYEVKTENVKLIKVKGMWYVDRRDGQMKYRLLGIAAMGQDPAMMGVKGPDGLPLPNDELIDLFWVFYPDAREVLANAVVFNSKNLSSDITFDDILNARRFSSIIYKSDNGMGDGTIDRYIPKDAQAQLDESDRIKNQILEMENTMWNY